MEISGVDQWMPYETVRNAVEEQAHHLSRQKARKLMPIKQLQDEILVITDVARAARQIYISIS
jgi:hypothetical protein